MKVPPSVATGVPKRLVFWQNNLSILQASVIRALACRGMDATWVVQELVGPRRRALGWSEPDYSPAKLVVCPNETAIASLIHTDPEGTVHFFSGLFAYPMVSAAFRASLRVQTRRALIVEAMNPNGAKGLARLARGRWHWVLYGQHIEFILALGQMGVNWYRRCGYPADRIYPYTYVVERPIGDGAGTPACGHEDAIRMLILAQCIERKGIDIALRALHGLRELPWRLYIGGDGRDRPALEALTASLGLASRVTFAGAIPHDRAMRMLADSDLLLLPSRFDGWGAVVNEALMRGVPAICSRRCGAADLLAEPWRGAVVQTGSVRSLRESIEARVAMGRPSREARRRIRDWARCLDAAAVADYALQVANSSATGVARPVAPWLVGDAGDRRR